MGDHSGGKDYRGSNQAANDKKTLCRESVDRRVETNGHDGGYTWVIRYQVSTWRSNENIKIELPAQTWEDKKKARHSQRGSMITKKSKTNAGKRTNS